MVPVFVCIAVGITVPSEATWKDLFAKRERLTLRAARTYVDRAAEVMEWSVSEKRGVLEVLYVASEFMEAGDLRTRATTLIGEIAASMVQNKTATGDKDREAVLRAQMIPLLMRDDHGSSDYHAAANAFLKSDQDNAVAWMLAAEADWWWARGSAYADKCRRAVCCRKFTFHEAELRRHMAAALRKAGLPEFDAKLVPFLLNCPLRDVAALRRHASILASLKHMLRGALELPDEGLVLDALVLRYYSCVSICRLAPYGVYTVPTRFLDTDPPARFRLTSDKGAPAGRAAEIADLRRKTSGLVRAQMDALRKEYVRLGTLATSGTLEELDAVLEDPTLIRRRIAASDPNLAKALDFDRVLAFWNKHFTYKKPEPAEESLTPPEPGPRKPSSCGREGEEKDRAKWTASCPLCGGTIPEKARRCPECAYKLDSSP